MWELRDGFLPELGLAHVKLVQGLPHGMVPANGGEVSVQPVQHMRRRREANHRVFAQREYRLR